MVHHYGGHRLSFKRHIEYLNSIGLDVYTFTIPISRMEQMTKLPFYENGFGLRHYWAKKISEVLDRVEGDKFIYSFSSPSASALDAMVTRQFNDVRGWICDGGPFTHLLTGMKNLVQEGEFGGKWAKHLSPLLSRYLVVMFGSINYEKEMGQLLRKIPKDFPIISFRTSNDKLIYPYMIDDFFKLGPVDIQPVLIERAGHLLGFRDAPERYKSFLLEYIKRNATANNT